MSSGVYRQVPQPQQPRRHAYPAATQTVTLATLTGSSAPTGLVVPSKIFQLATLTGSSTPTGLVTTSRVTPLATQTGSSTPLGALKPFTVTINMAGSCAPVGQFVPIKLPAAGTWMGPTRALEEAPVYGSVTSWSEYIPPGAHAYVRTSIDNGSTWQLATNGGPIPRLAQGLSVVRSILYKVDYDRPTGADPAPIIRNLLVYADQNKTRRESVPLGTFVPVDVDITEGDTGLQIDIEAADLSLRVTDNAWEQIKTFPKDTNLGEVVRQIILDRYPDAELDFESTNATALATLTVGAGGTNDPFADARKVARKAGMELYVNYAGVFVMRSPPDADVDPVVWKFSDRDKPSIIDLKRRLTKTGTANRIVIEGESVNGSTPVRAQVDDDDPTSPNNIHGPEGIKTYRLIVKGIDANQAVVMARAEALKRKGALETVGLSVPPVPHLEEGDVIECDRSVVGLTGRYLLQSFDIPFEADARESVEARRRAMDASDSGGDVGGLDGDTGNDTGGGSGGTVPRTYTTPGECHKIGTNGNLNFFKLQTAFPGDSAITEKSVAQIGAGYAKSPEYCMNAASTAVQMRVSLNAPTTSGSSNPRTEYREMQSNGTTNAAWTGSSGQHWVQCTIKPTKLANNNKSCSLLQVHDASDDVIQVLTRKIGGTVKLVVRLNGTDNDSWVLDGSFDDLPEFTCRVEVNGGVGKFWYHRGSDPSFSGSPTLQTGSGGLPSLTFSGGCYFKVGVYSQQTSSESGSDYASADFRKLGLFHPGYASPVFDSDFVDTGGGSGSDFAVGFGACINNTDSPALGSLASAGLDWFVMLGDCWYKDGSTPNWVSDWNTKFAASNYASLISSLPSADRHVVSWSDHDFGYANNSTGLDNPSRTSSANSAYRTKFGTSGTGVQGATLPSSGIYRTWTYGRVRFVLLDMLTFKSTLGTANSSSRTMLGSTQKAWYKNILATAAEPLIVVFGDGQIPGPAEDNQDEWRGYAAERSELSSAVSASPRTVIYCNGDTHSLAYGHDQYGYARVWQSAPLNNETKVKAGGSGYTETYPTNANEGPIKQLHAIMTFTDTGSSISVTFRGYEGSTVRLTDSITVNG